MGTKTCGLLSYSILSHAHLTFTRPGGTDFFPWILVPAWAPNMPWAPKQRFDVSRGPAELQRLRPHSAGHRHSEPTPGRRLAAAPGLSRREKRRHEVTPPPGFYGGPTIRRSSESLFSLVLKGEPKRKRCFGLLFGQFCCHVICPLALPKVRSTQGQTCKLRSGNLETLGPNP